MTFTILLDQISKGAVQKILVEGEGRVLIPNFLKIVHIQSPATALGFVGNGTITILSLLILLWALRRLIILQKSDPLQALPYVLLIAGLAGNSMDRILYGHVVSFIQIFSWVFNFSDMLIVAALILSLFNIGRFFLNKNASSCI